MDLSIYKIDLDTDQPNGGKGESPRSAFTKYNNSLDTINDELTTLGENVGTINDELTTLGENVGTINDELTTLDDSAMKKADNLSDLTDKETARSNLGLGTAATRDVGASSGQLMEVGAFGLGRIASVSATRDFRTKGPDSQFFYGYQDTEFLGINAGVTLGYSLHWWSQIVVAPGAVPIVRVRSYYNGNSYSPVYTIYHSGNTTVGSNGFIKIASPIVKLFSDFIEKTEHLEIEEAELERVGVGHYVLHNVPSLSKDGWYIETPKDRNGNIYFYLDYVEDEDSKTLTIKTYEPDYSTGRAEAGEPVDILEGRFVSLRFEEDPSLYPELEEPKTEEE